eukprot:scaffold1466_cov385-Prasinococcus_capsulatus_cf.AAC.4
MGAYGGLLLDHVLEEVRRAAECCPEATRPDLAGGTTTVLSSAGVGVPCVAWSLPLGQVLGQLPAFYRIRTFQFSVDEVNAIREGVNGFCHLEHPLGGRKIAFLAVGYPGFLEICEQRQQVILAALEGCNQGHTTVAEHYFSDSVHNDELPYVGPTGTCLAGVLRGGVSCAAPHQAPVLLGRAASTCTTTCSTGTPTSPQSLRAMWMWPLPLPT